MPAPDQELLRHYLEELSYLRSMGGRFARAHPEVAANLQLRDNVSPDPHVERLIESFAFLTARIQNNLAADFPEIAAELLQTLYPHFLNPIPSMTILRFLPKKQPPDNPRVPRGTMLFKTTAEGDVVRFQTCYDADVWPIEVADVSVAAGFDFRYPTTGRSAVSVLRLRLRATAKNFAELGVDTLRFFLDSESAAGGLVPLLAGGERRRVAVVDPGDFVIRDPTYLEVAPAGFAADEGLIPLSTLSHPAYRLLQEYFAFEQKFHFVDVKGLRGRLGPRREADLLFLLDAEPPARTVLHRDDFVLGCTPAVNLFTKTSEPIRVDHRTIEYRLVPDYRREASTAVHSVDFVSGSSNAAERSRAYAPFYSFTHEMARDRQSAFWHARRDGDDLFLSFRDTAFNPALPPDEVVYAHLFCTNRDYAAAIEAKDKLDADEDLPAEKIVTLRKPTSLLRPRQGGALLWRLVSHLSFSRLSIDGGEEALRALREILLLYCPEDATAALDRIGRIKSVSARKITGRVADSWNGFARGTEITLVFEKALAEKDGFLFASVLSHFFGLYASINSFTKLVVRRDDEGDVRFRDPKGMQWPLMTGSKAVL